MSEIKTGQKVKASIDAYPGVEFWGTVSRVNPQVDADINTTGFQSVPLLAASRVDYSHLPECGDSRDEAALLNHYNQIEAARLVGFCPNRMFASAHVVHPMQRSIMAGLFADHQDRCIYNSAFRFRSTAQFLPQSLHNHHCIKNSLGRINMTRDHIHIAANTSRKWSSTQINDFMAGALWNKIKFMCINELPEVERQFPDVHKWIETAIS